MWYKAHAEVKIKDNNNYTTTFISTENGRYCSKEMAVGYLTDLVCTIFKTEYIEEIGIVTTPTNTKEEE